MSFKLFIIKFLILTVRKFEEMSNKIDLPSIHHIINADIAGQ